MKLLLCAAVILFSLSATAKKVRIYIPPHFWTKVHTYNCKEISPTMMRCTADIEFAGYSLTKPESATEQYPKAKIEAR